MDIKKINLVASCGRAKLALRLKPIVQAKAKENKSANGGYKKSENQKSDTPINKISTDKELAKIAGVSHDTIENCIINRSKCADSF